MPVASRLVEIRGSGEGSGYLITSRLVLTAWHVICLEGGDVPGPVKVRVEGKIGRGMKPSAVEEPATVLWPLKDPGEHLDLALLLLSRPVLLDDGEVEPVAWAELPDSGVLDVESIGYPNAAINRSTRTRSTRGVRGWTSLSDGIRERKQGQGTFQIRQLIADQPGGAPASAWPGMSGAAVFGADALLGVIRQAGKQNELGILEAVPVERLFERPDVLGAAQRAGCALPERRKSTSQESADSEGLELLCDRFRVVQGFVDMLKSRPDPLRPGCMILFGEVDQAHHAFFERIKTYTLTSRHRARNSRNRQHPFGVHETVDVPNLQAFYGRENTYAAHIIREVAEHLDGDPGEEGLEDLEELYRHLYRVLKTKKLALCLINCFVHVETHDEADWWIRRFHELQHRLSLEAGGPQVMFSLSIQYSRGSWFLRRSRDLSHFFRKHYPAAFATPDVHVRRRKATTLPPDLIPWRLSPVTKKDLELWLAEPLVEGYIRRTGQARRLRAKVLEPFESKREHPMWYVLDHLRDIMRAHPA